MGALSFFRFWVKTSKRYWDYCSMEKYFYLCLNKIYTYTTKLLLNLS
jgi:hypothetical protein